jgi:hypothetical protein
VIGVPSRRGLPPSRQATSAGRRQASSGGRLLDRTYHRWQSKGAAGWVMETRCRVLRGEAERSPAAPADHHRHDARHRRRPPRHRSPRHLSHGCVRGWSCALARAGPRVAAASWSDAFTRADAATASLARADNAGVVATDHSWAGEYSRPGDHRRADAGTRGFSGHDGSSDDSVNAADADIGTNVAHPDTAPTAAASEPNASLAALTGLIQFVSRLAGSRWTHSTGRRQAFP